jgi:ubiquinone/menaquinone biosynthesis C-methylase UbiE
MLQRQLETEIMNTVEEARDYDAMDHSTVNQLFTSDFCDFWTGENPILDVGTGTAQIPIELCRTDTRPSITAIDLSDEMLKIARSNVEAAGLSSRITLENVDAKRFPYPDGHFGAVISNSIVHHIPEPAGVFAEMVRVCQPNGTIFVRDLMRPPGPNTLKRLVDVYAAGANDHQRQLFSDSLQAALTLDEVREIVAGLGFDPDTVEDTSDRHWTWTARR